MVFGIADMASPSDSSTKLNSSSDDGLAPLAGQLQDRPLSASENLSWFTPNVQTVAGSETALPWSTSTAQPLPQIPNYRVDAMIGRGGMGVVYKAFDEALKRPVAIKMVLQGEFADAKELQRFRTEAQAIAQLRHPNIVQIYSIGELSGRPFFALEYLPGGTLAERIQGHVQDPRSTATLLCQLARAIQHAHEQGIVHRDLKPNNILFDSDNNPHITDFGLAKLLQEQSQLHDSKVNSLTQTGTVVGTPQYMAPEQASGGSAPVSPAVDIYALGVILYEMLTGRRPFDAVHPIDVFIRVRTEDPVALSVLQPSIPKDLETICLKCLAKLPQQRYVSASALADDLERFLRHEPILASPVSRFEKAIKWMRRHPSWTLAGLIFLLSLASITMLVWIYTDKLEQALLDLIKARKDEQQERQRAEHNLSRAIQTIEEFLLRIGAERLEDVPYMDEIRRDILRDALNRFKELFADESSRPQLKQQIAKYLVVMGVLEERLGQYKEAEHHLEEAWSLHEELLKQDPNNETWQDSLDTALHNLARTKRAIGNYSASQNVVTRLQQLRENRLIHFPDRLDLRIDMAALLNDHLYPLHMEQGRDKEAIAVLKQGYQQVTLIQTDHPNEFKVRRLAVMLSSNLAKDLKEGDPLCLYYCTQALAQLNKLTSKQARLPESLYQRAVVEKRFGELQANLGFKEDKVLPHFVTATQIADLLVRDYPAVLRYKQTLALCLDRQAEYLYRFHPESILECLQLRERAEQLLLSTLEIPENNTHLTQHFLAGIYHNHSSLLYLRKEYGAAVDLLQKSIHHQKVALQSSPNHSEYLLHQNNHFHLLALVYMHSGQFKECVHSIEALRQLIPRHPYSGFIAARLYMNICAFHSKYQFSGKAPTEMECLQEALLALQEAYRNGYTLTKRDLQNIELKQLTQWPPFQEWLRSIQLEK